MKPAPSLVHGVSWTLAGNIGFAACQWGMLVVLARVGTPSVVGEFALALAVTAPIFLLFGLSLRTVQATDSRARFRFGDYLRLRAATTALALGATLVVVVITGLEAAMLTILVVGGAKGFAALMDAYHGLFQRARAMELIARSILLSGALSLTGVALLFLVTRNVEWAAIGFAAGPAVALIAYVVPVSRRFRASTAESGHADSPRRRGGRALPLAWLALPLGLSAGLMSFAVNVPRYGVDLYLGDASLGVFAALAYVTVVGNTFVSALADAALPALADHYWARRDAAFRGLLARLVATGGVLALGAIALAWVAGRAALELLYGPLYAAHHEAFVWLVAGTGIGFVGWFLNAGLSAVGSYRAQLVTTGGLLLGTVVGSVAWIPSHGLVGAAWAVVAGAAAQTALRMAILGSVVIRSGRAHRSRLVTTPPE